MDVQFAPHNRQPAAMYINGSFGDNSSGSSGMLYDSFQLVPSGSASTVSSLSYSQQQQQRQPVNAYYNASDNDNNNAYYVQSPNVDFFQTYASPNGNYVSQQIPNHYSVVNGTQFPVSNDNAMRSSQTVCFKQNAPPYGNNVNGKNSYANPNMNMNINNANRMPSSSYSGIADNSVIAVNGFNQQPGEYFNYKNNDTVMLTTPAPPGGNITGISIGAQRNYSGNNNRGVVVSSLPNVISQISTPNNAQSASTRTIQQNVGNMPMKYCPDLGTASTSHPAQLVAIVRAPKLQQQQYVANSQMLSYNSPSAKANVYYTAPSFVSNDNFHSYSGGFQQQQPRQNVTITQRSSSYSDELPVITVTRANFPNSAIKSNYNLTGEASSSIRLPTVSAAQQQPAQEMQTLAINGAESGNCADLRKERARQLRKHLVLLLHSHSCLRRDRASNAVSIHPCNIPHCSLIKSVLKHLETCKAGLDCDVPHCSTSRHILSHFKSCSNINCDICSDVKKHCAAKNALNNPVNDEQQLSVEVGGQGSNNSVQPNDVSDSTMSCSSRGPLSSENSETEKLLKGPTPDQQNSSNGDWKSAVKLTCREFLVTKISNTILSLPNRFPAANIESRWVEEVHSYAQKTEDETFSIANSLNDYYQRLAEKIHQIKKEYELKRLKRSEEFLKNNNTTQCASFDPSQAHNFAVDLKNLDSTVPPNRLAPMAAISQEVSDHQKQLLTNTAIDFNNKQAANLVVKNEFLQIKSEYSEVKSEFSESRTISKQFMFDDSVNESLEVDLTMPRKSSTPPKDSVHGPYFTRNLRSNFSTILNFVLKLNESSIFKDSDKSGDISSDSINFSTVERRVNQGEYDKDPWKFCDDMFSILEAVFLNHKKISRPYKFALKIYDEFSPKIEKLMVSLGYCCGKRYSFSPLALICYGGTGAPMCSIPRDAEYYCWQSQFSSNDRYTYCKKCFDQITGDLVYLTDDAGDQSAANSLPKSEFVLMKNDNIVYEPFVECTVCNRKMHTICVLHVQDIYQKFVCINCKGVKDQVENVFTAKRLPSCDLSQFMESRVNNLLRDNGQTGAEIIIRVVASMDKEVEVKSLTKAKYCSPGGLPEKFPYRTKVIYVFQVIDGVEVCFFALHVQEYGDQASAPNNRRIYIAYLDSVNFFRPKEYRTAVYYEILLSYLDYCRQLGYSMVHIWACPPNEGDDYIFNCHPPEQKIPKAKRLQDWYKSLLDRAVVQEIILDYKDLFKYVKEEGLQSVMQLPYFEGDYWTNIIEDSIREYNEHQSNGVGVTLIDDYDEAEAIYLDQRKISKQLKRSKSKSKVKPSKKAKKSLGYLEGDVNEKVFSLVEKHKDIFFVVKLNNKLNGVSPKKIEDPDPLVNCELMDNRDYFLSTCRERFWEFSSLRRAKFSTLSMCYELHTLNKESYHCDMCKSVDVAYHCPECDDFDMCESCFKTSGHKHQMTLIKQSASIDEQSTSISPAKSSFGKIMDPRKLSTVLDALMHASQCRDANCTKILCQRFRGVLVHNRSCDKRSVDCKLCKFLYYFVRKHAENCRHPAGANCQMPHCEKFRQLIATQQALLKTRRDREAVCRINALTVK